MPTTGTHTLTSEPRTMILEMMKFAEEKGRQVLAKHGREITPEALEHAGYVIFTAMFEDLCGHVTPEDTRKLQTAMGQLADEALASPQE